MPTQITTVRDSLLSTFSTFMNFVPTLIGAIIVVAIGWLVSSLVARLIQRLLHVARLDQLSAKAGIDRFLIGPAGHYSASHGVSILAKWFIRLIFVQAAANLLNMPQVTAIINSILLFIPNLAVALVLLVIGAYAAQFVSGLVQESVSKAGVANSKFLGLLARYAIIGFAVIAALDHIGVAVTLVNTLFIGLVASISLAVGLAFGLGSQGVASEMARTWYEHGKIASSNLKVLSSEPGSPERKKTGSD